MNVTSSVSALMFEAKCVTSCLMCVTSCLVCDFLFHVCHCSAVVRVTDAVHLAQCTYACTYSAL